MISRFRVSRATCAIPGTVAPEKGADNARVTGTQGAAQPPRTSVSLDHFIGMYEAKTDPWDTATKWHDRRKYAVTVASLPRERYRRCYEPGASVGLLTRLLAPRCDEILATDAVPEAVRASSRTSASSRRCSRPTCRTARST
jgi:hypothetical protein